MRRLTIFVVLLSATALAFIIIRASAQNPQNPQIPSPDYPFPGYPEEFSPMKTWRPGKPGLTKPTGKFLKAAKPVPKQYIVKLKDDVVPKDKSIKSKQDQISEIAAAHASAHRGKVTYIYGAVLGGYSIELPNEAAARAISNNPQVELVSEVEQYAWGPEEGDGDGINFELEPGDLEPEGLQSNPPWGLDAIDGSIPQGAPNPNTGRSNGQYLYNATGAGVVAFVLDSGIFNQHEDFSTGFFSRASQFADCFTYVNCHNGQFTPYSNQQVCVFPMPNQNNNDCVGHGTHVAGVIGGNFAGVAKQVTIKSIKVGSTFGVTTDALVKGINEVTINHLENSSVPAVANISLGGSPDSQVDNAVIDSIRSGVTYVIAAGNTNRAANNISPARVPEAVTVGAVDWTAVRFVLGPSAGSNFGPVLDIFAPGVLIPSPQSGNGICSIWGGTNHEYCLATWGTSFAAPHITGLIATHLQGRTASDQCFFYPVEGPAPPCCGDPSACPDRVTRFIDANAKLSVVSNLSGIDFDPNGNLTVFTSPSRFSWNLSIPSRLDPIDNQRFFVWQQYSDFIPNDIFGHPQPEPDEGGLDWWTRQITDHCGTGPNDNNECTHVWRILTSRAFFVATHPSWFDSNYGLTVSNTTFVDALYSTYLRRGRDSNFWIDNMTANYGNPANATGVFNAIDAFISCHDYRYRFGPS
jgi:subtilisin family serine protease